MFTLIYEVNGEEKTEYFFNEGELTVFVGRMFRQYGYGFQVLKKEEL